MIFNAEEILKLINEFKNSNWLERKKAHIEIINKVSNSIENANELIILIKNILYTETDCNSSDFKNILYWSIKTLGMLQITNNAYKLLIEIIKDTKFDNKYREIAILELSNFKYNDEIRDNLILFLSDKCWKIRQVSANILINYSNYNIAEYLICNFFSFSNDDTIYWVLQIIAKIKKENAIKFFSNILFSSTTNIRIYTLLALCEIKTEEAFKVIVSYFDDPSYLVRMQVYQIVEKNLSQCAKFVKEFTMSADFRTRCDAFKFLVKSMNPEFNELIFNMINSGSIENRILGLSSLYGVFNENTVNFIYEHFNDESWYVRHYAALVMSSFGEKVLEYLLSKYPIEINENNRYWIIMCIKNIINYDKVNHIENICEIFSISTKSEKLQLLNLVEDIINKTTNDIIKSNLIIKLIELTDDQKWLVRKRSSEILHRLDYELVSDKLKTINNLSENQLFWLKDIISKNK